MKMKKKSWFFSFIFASLFFIFNPFPYNLNQQTNASFNRNFLAAKIENFDDKNDNFDEQDKINLVNEIEQKSNNDGIKNNIKIYSNQMSVLNYNQDDLDREQNQNEINQFFLTNPINQSDNRQKDNYSYFNDKDDKNDNEKKDSDTKHKVLISLLATLVLILTITLVTLTVKKVHEVKNPTNKPD